MASLCFHYDVEAFGKIFGESLPSTKFSLQKRFSWSRWRINVQSLYLFEIQIYLFVEQAVRRDTKRLYKQTFPFEVRWPSITWWHTALQSCPSSKFFFNAASSDEVTSSYWVFTVHLVLFTCMFQMAGEIGKDLSWHRLPTGHGASSLEMFRATWTWSW